MVTMEFVVGDRVRVICVRASHGWGWVSRGDIGTVSKVLEKELIVTFPKQIAWCGLLREFELVEAAKNGPNRELKKPTREW